MREHDEGPNAPKPLPRLDGGPPRPPKVTIRDMEDDFRPGECILDEIARRMRRFPSARVVRSDNSISYIPDDPDGFIVKLTERRGFPSYFVSYGKCVAAFESRSLAVTQFGFGLCTECRLREELRGGWLVYQAAEILLRSRWQSDYPMQPWSCWPKRFFTRTIIRHRRNHLIDLETPAASCAA